jgi:hypothetical protein
MHMAPRVAAWVAWAVWTCNTPQQGIRSKESGLRSALFFGGGHRVLSPNRRMGNWARARRSYWEVADYCV